MTSPDVTWSAVEAVIVQVSEPAEMVRTRDGRLRPEKWEERTGTISPPPVAGAVRVSNERMGRVRWMAYRMARTMTDNQSLLSSGRGGRGKGQCQEEKNGLHAGFISTPPLEHVSPEEHAYSRGKGPIMGLYSPLDSSR